MGMNPKKTPANTELYWSWMLGCLLLLVSNMTLFRKYDASIGEPWLNIALGAGIVALLGRMAWHVFRSRRRSRLEKSRILELDGMDETAFGEFMAETFCRAGADIRHVQCSSAGYHLYLDYNGALVHAVIRKSRRKLTHEAVMEAAALEGPEGITGACAAGWIITNGGFTTEARKRAAASNYRLFDREQLIARLASQTEWKL